MQKSRQAVTGATTHNFYIRHHIGIADDQVIAGAAFNFILSFTTLQHILRGAAKDMIIAITTISPIALSGSRFGFFMLCATAAKNKILARHAEEEITTCTANNGIAILILVRT